MTDKTIIGRVTRDGCGFYTCSDGQRRVSVLRNDQLAGPDKWIAGAQWDRHLYTDPLPTKRQAVAAARRMLRFQP